MATATTATTSEMSTMRILFFEEVLGSFSSFIVLSLVVVVDVVGAAVFVEGVGAPSSCRVARVVR